MIPSLSNIVRVVVERPRARLGEEVPPAPLRRVGRGEQRRDEEPGRRDQPEHGDQDEHDVDRRPAQEANDPSREARVGIDGGLDSRVDGGVDGGHQFVSARKRRMFDDQEGDEEDQDERRDRGAEPEAVLTAEGDLPLHEGEGGRVVLGRARGDREDQVEDLEHADDLRHEDDGQHGREQRDRDPPEHLPLARPVGARRFERVARDRGEARGGDHHREARVAPR